MGTLRRPSGVAVAVQAYVALAVILLVTHGIDAVAVLTVIAVLVASFFVRRHIENVVGEQYQRHGDQMD
jgi:hypothetical protein